MKLLYRVCHYFQHFTKRLQNQSKTFENLFSYSAHVESSSEALWLHSAPMACEEFYDRKKRLNVKIHKKFNRQKKCHQFRLYCTRCHVRRTQILISSFDIVGKMGWLDCNMGIFVYSQFIAVCTQSRHFRMLR